MAYSAAPDFTINYLCFFPETGETLAGQLADCYRQFAENHQKQALSKNSVVKQTIFISVSDPLEYFEIKQELLLSATNFFGKLPPTSILAQSPENESIAVEFMVIEGAQSEELTYKHTKDTSWLVFQRGEIKMIVAAGLGTNKESGNIQQHSEVAFGQLHQILNEEQMEFSDIIRQWNYIEQITETIGQDNLPSQHYQIFNDVRSRYYQISNFKNGFPAATGIGMDFGGIIIDVIAASFGKDIPVIPVKSPVQTDAYIYSKEVLAENNIMCDFCRTTPKFERAKIISTPRNKWILVSGTAAISGQASDTQSSVVHQTEMTIQNIERLISAENLQKHGISANEKPVFNYLRVYVKHKKDMQQVKEICFKFYPNIPAVYVEADICRPELLVEIEGQARIG